MTPAGERFCEILRKISGRTTAAKPKPADEAVSHLQIAIVTSEDTRCEIIRSRAVEIITVQVDSDVVRIHGDGSAVCLQRLGVLAFREDLSAHLGSGRNSLNTNSALWTHFSRKG